MNSKSDFVKITKQEEIELVARYKKAVENNDREDIKEIMLIMWEQLGAYANNQLRKSYPTYYEKEVWRKEMFQEVYALLHEEFCNFDPNTGRLITWSKRHIQHAAQTYINRECMKTSDHYAQGITRIKRAMAEANKEGIENLTISELSERTKLPQTTIKTCLSIINRTNVVHIESNEFNGDTYIKGEDPLPEQQVILAEEMLDLKKALATLTDLERQAIDLKYGLSDGVQLKYPEIAERLNVTKEKISKTVSSAEQKLKKILSKSASFAHRASKGKKDENQPITFTPIDNNDENYLLQALGSIESEDIDF